MTSFPLLPIRPLNSIPYTGMLLGDIRKTKVYELIKLGLLDARKLGPLTRITGESIKALIDSLPKGVGDSPQSEDCRGATAKAAKSCDEKTTRPGTRRGNQTTPRGRQPRRGVKSRMSSSYHTPAARELAAFGLHRSGREWRGNYPSYRCSRRY
jgi:hypothetical protein